MDLLLVRGTDGPYHPDRYEDGISLFVANPCSKTPSVADPCLAAIGLCSYALDSLLMRRPRYWNFRQGHLHGEIPELIRQVPRSAACPVCQSNGKPSTDGYLATSI